MRVVTDEKEMCDIIKKGHMGIKGSQKFKAMGSHFGHDKTMESLRLQVYFPGMKTKITLYVTSCEGCKRVKAGSKFEKDVQNSNQLMSQHRPGINMGLI